MRFFSGFITALLIAAAVHGAGASGLPVRNDHPRLLFTPDILAQLRAKMTASHPHWMQLKAQADVLSTYTIYPYKFLLRGEAPEGTIYYSYQAEGWYDAAFPLGFAYIASGDMAYCNKLLALADEMIRAQTDPENLPPDGMSPLGPGNYYPTRNIGPVIAMIYDWCYDKLGATRKAAMIALMEAYFDDMRMNAYQRNDHADGNYYVGHMIAAAWMGYALHGDSPRAQTMIDYARMRFDNSPSALIDPDSTPEDYFAQLFEGGTRPQLGRDYNGPLLSGAPFLGGFDLQGWAYGGETFNRIIDYLQIIKTATSEDLFPARRSWFSQILRMEKHTLMPNRFELWPCGDWGGDYGAAINHSLPLRLAAVLAGTPDGPGAQHFVSSWIAKNSPYPEFREDIYQDVFHPREWEDFYYADSTRPSADLVLPPYYSGFGPVYPQAGPTNGSIPNFFMRSDWGTSATWASIHMGAAWYDDHQHFDAGHFWIKRGNEYLLIDATNWKGDAGSIGIVGSSRDEEYGAAAAANTLHFNDYGDSMLPEMSTHGGQGVYGRDDVIAAEQNMAYSYIRSDLSTAYNRAADTTDTNQRRLDFFYRAFVYLRQANLFVLYDQVKALPSSNPIGPYRKHLRWHFPVRPTVTGNTTLVEFGESRLHMAMLSPDNPLIKAVDEATNPDPCDGSVTPCTPYEMTSGTWRIEVGDAANPLYIPFLTVLQPGTRTLAAPVTTRLMTSDANMIGARVVAADGLASIVLFNAAQTQLQTPISAASYSTPSASAASHMLCGMKPGTKYAANIAGDNVTVTESPSGAFVSSEAGVLRFGVLPSDVERMDPSVPAALALGQNYPNPMQGSGAFTYTVPRASQVVIELFDMLGKKVATLVDEAQDAGSYRYAFRDSALPNGVYLCRLHTNDQAVTRMLTVAR
ncbi:MAG: T9SS type A sorting domain-containing protein [Ignavibacteria bacterium]|nr:T9SS type A sorting domain-containing protein [Ignavibacteria bacterium]